MSDQNKQLFMVNVVWRDQNRINVGAFWCDAYTTSGEYKVISPNGEKLNIVIPPEYYAPLPQKSYNLNLIARID